MPLVIINLGSEHTHTYTQTRIPTIRTGSILRNQAHAGLRLACTLFKNLYETMVKFSMYLVLANGLAFAR